MKLVRFDDAIDVRGYLDIVKALIDQTISDLDHVPVAQPGNGDHASLARRAPVPNGTAAAGCGQPCSPLAVGAHS